MNRISKVIDIILCVLLFTLMMGCEKALDTTITDQTSQPNVTLSIKSIEEHIIDKNDFDDFVLRKISVHVVDSKEHYSSIGIVGMKVAIV